MSEKDTHPGPDLLGEGDRTVAFMLERHQALTPKLADRSWTFAELERAHADRGDLLELLGQKLDA